MPQQKKERHAGFYLFVGLLIIGLFTSHATLSIDPPNRYLVAKSIVDHGDLQVRPIPGEPSLPGVDPGIDGNLYSRFGIGQPLIFVGPYFVAKHVLGIQSDKLIRSLISLTIFPLSLAMTACFFYLLAGEFGIEKRFAYWSAVLLILATGIWQTSKEGQEDTHLAFLFVAAAFGLRKFQNTGRYRFLLLSSIAAGFAFLTRSDTTPFIFCYLMLAGGIIISAGRSLVKTTSAIGTRPSTGFAILIVIMGTLPAFGIHCWLCHSHFGNWLTPPHQPLLLKHLPMGLSGLLYSPGRSVFLYNPVILLAIPGLVIFWKSHRGWAACILAAFLGSVLLHGATENFHGNCCWGPRYLTRYFPLLFLPVTFLLAWVWQNKTIAGGGRFIRMVFGLIILLSLLVQIAAVSGHHVRELAQLQKAYNVGWSDRQWTMFEPEANFLKIRLINLSKSVREMAHHQIPPWSETPNHLLSIDDQLNAPVLHYLAFWPFHLTYYLPAVKPGLAAPLWASSTILIGGILFGAFLLWRGGRAAKTQRCGIAKTTS